MVKDLDDGNWGLYVHDKKAIYLNAEKINHPDIWPTFVHECIHACLTISGVAEGLGNQEEAVCRSIENLSHIFALRKK